MTLGTKQAVPGTLWAKPDDVVEFEAVPISDEGAFKVYAVTEKLRSAPEDPGVLTVMRFESLDDLRSVPLFREKGDYFDLNWGGVSSARNLYALERHGWQEGAQVVASIGAKMERTFTGMGTVEDSVRHGTDGQVVDVGRFVSGEPEHMATFDDPRPGKGRIVNLTLNPSMSCSFEPEDYFRRGVLSCVLCDRLERLGYRVELTLNWQCGNEERVGMVASIVAKRASQPLDLEEAAFLMCHPAAMRASLLCRIKSETIPERVRKMVCDQAARAGAKPLGYGNLDYRLFQGYRGCYPLSTIEPPLIKGLAHFAQLYGYGGERVDKIIADTAEKMKAAGVVFDPGDTDWDEIARQGLKAIRNADARLSKEVA